MARRRAPACIEEDGKRKVRPLENWHTMSEEYALMVSEYHHRCALCYVRWLSMLHKVEVRRDQPDQIDADRVRIHVLDGAPDRLPAGRLSIPVGVERDQQVNVRSGVVVTPSP